MSKAVKCPICGKVKILQKPGKKFNHCGMRHPVEENRVTSFEKRGEEKEVEEISLGDKEELKRTVKEIMKELEQENPSEKLVINGSRSSAKKITKEDVAKTLKGSKKSSKKKNKKTYKCPVCGYKMNKKFSGCPMCYTDLTW